MWGTLNDGFLSTRVIFLLGILIQDATLSTEPGLVPTIGPTFGNRFQALCTGSVADSEACLSLIMSGIKENYVLTQDLSQKNEALVDASDRAVSDWDFAVKDFERVQPLVDQYVSSGRPPMQNVVKGLQSNVSDFSSSIKPELKKYSDAFRNLSTANEADMLDLTQQVEKAAQSALQRVVVAADLSQTAPSQYAVNITKSLQEYWDTEFSKIKSLVASDQDRIGGQINVSQSMLANITSFFHDRLNALKRESTNLSNYMANNSVINRIATSQNSLHQSLKSFTDQLLESTLSKAYGRLIPRLSDSSAFALSNFSDHFNASLDQLGEAIDANITSAINLANRGETAAKKEFKEIDTSFARDIGAYGQLLGDAATAVGLMKNDTSNISNPYLVTDVDLGPDSLVLFSRKKNAVESQLNVSTSDMSTQVSKVTADLSSYTNTALLELNQTIAALTMLVGTLAHPNMSSGIDPVYLNWTQYAAGVSQTTLPGIVDQFKLMLANVSDWVFKSEFLDKMTSESHSIDPNIGALMTGNYRFLNQSEMLRMDKYVESQKAAIQAWVSRELADIQSKIKRGEKSDMLDKLNADFTSALESKSKKFAADIEDQRDDADAATTELSLALVEGPAANLSSILTGTETKLKGEILKLQNLQKTISEVVNDLVATNKTVESTGKSLAAQIGDRDRKLAASIAGVISDMNRAISDYAMNFANTLPSSLAIDIGTFQKQLDNAENLVIKTQSDSMTTALEKKIERNKLYVKSIQSAADEVLGRGRGLIDGLKNTKDIDYDVLFPDSIPVIDDKGVMNKAIAAAQAQAAMTENVLHQKSGELVQAVQAQTALSANRDTQLNGVESEFNARQTAETNLKASLEERVISAINTANQLLSNTNDTITEMDKKSRTKMNSLSTSLSKRAKDLLFHVTESAPEFVSQYESEQIDKLVAKLRLINSTVNDINREAVGQFGVLDLGSLIDNTEYGVKPSEAMMSLMSLLRKDHETEHRIENETWGVLRGLNASIRAHVPLSYEQTVDNKTENEFVDAITRALNKTRNFEDESDGQVEKVVRTYGEFETEQQHIVEGNVSAIHNLVGYAQQVLDLLNTTEKTDVSDNLSSLSSRVSNLRGIVDRFSNLSSMTITPSVQDITTELQRPLVAVTVPRLGNNSVLSDANQEFTSHVVKTDSLLNQRVADQSKSFNSTLDSIASIYATVRSLTESEDKLESEFEDKIVGKFHKRNDKYEKEFEAELGQVRDEMEHTVASFEDKQGMQSELHDLIRNLRRQHEDKPK